MSRIYIVSVPTVFEYRTVRIEDELWTQRKRNARLVECNPVLDTVTHSLEDDTSVARKVLDPFVLVAQRTPVLLVKSLRCVPVVQSHKRRDACCDQVVDKLHVVLETFLVDGIVATAFGDDA
jgi:hypothetical protein